MDSLLYDTFFATDKYKTLKGDGGNELVIIIENYIKNISDEETLKQIKNEVKNWLLTGRLTFFTTAMNIAAKFNWQEFKPILERTKLNIIKKYISDFPDHTIFSIDNALKRLS